MKISDLDELTRTLEDAQHALQNLAGNLEVSFNSDDPESIEDAIRKAEAMVDARIAQWADNPIASNLAEQAKAQIRQAIIDRAAASRLQESGHDDE